MRDIYLDCEGYPGCCKVDVIYNFEGIDEDDDPPLTSDEWFQTFLRHSGPGPIYTFAHSTEENGGPCTPKNLARWLRGRGEKVVALRWKHITMYMWTPSPKFSKDLLDYKNKKKEQNDGRGVFDSY